MSIDPKHEAYVAAAEGRMSRRRFMRRAVWGGLGLCGVGDHPQVGRARPRDGSAPPRGAPLEVVGAQDPGLSGACGRPGESKIRPV